MNPGGLVPATNAPPGNDALVTPDGRFVPLVDGLTIGRADDATIQLVDAAVSREHAVVQRQGTRWLIRDRGSRNGTRVNEARLPAFTDHVLRDGDRVSIGRLTMRVRLVDTPDAEATVTLRSVDMAVALSPYQLQVIAALAQPWLEGKEPATNAAIAKALGTPLAVEAVKAALRRCYAKVGLADLPTHTKRRELCRLANERGWV
jgi:hypothetical protein